MMVDARLLYRFWVEVLFIVVYFLNRRLIKVVKGMILFEVWTGEKLNVEYLRVFGCVVYVYVVKDNRKKFDVKFRKCIFLGYGIEIKVYRFYYIKYVKGIYSWDVYCRGIEELSKEEKENVRLCFTKIFREFFGFLIMIVRV